MMNFKIDLICVLVAKSSLTHFFARHNLSLMVPESFVCNDFMVGE